MLVKERGTHLKRMPHAGTVHFHKYLIHKIGPEIYIQKRILRRSYACLFKISIYGFIWIIEAERPENIGSEHLHIVAGAKAPEPACVTIFWLDTEAFYEFLR